MGTYVVTGGASGIGAKTVEELRKRGDEVCVLDIVNGDIQVNLGSAAERLQAIEELHRRYPNGIDGLICNAGVTVSKRITPADVISINYFGAVQVAEGCYDLLLKRKGACVVTASGSLCGYQRKPYDIAELLNNDGNEQRIRKLVDTFEQDLAGPQMYIVSKYALVRWVRRVCGAWGYAGVNINAIAPGTCATKLTEDMPQEAFEQFVLGYLPMPTYYKAKTKQDADELANSIVFLASSAASGINGELVFCDGGSDGMLRSERFIV